MYILKINVSSPLVLLFTEYSEWARIECSAVLDDCELNTWKQVIWGIGSDGQWYEQTEKK